MDNSRRLIYGLVPYEPLPQTQPGMKHTFRVITHWGLLIHIYVSMVGFTLVLLFAVTGLTLNHQDFGLSNPEITTKTISIPAELMEQPRADTISDTFRTRSACLRRQRTIGKTSLRSRSPLRPRADALL